MTNYILHEEYTHAVIGDGDSNKSDSYYQSLLDFTIVASLYFS